MKNMKNKKLYKSKDNKMLSGVLAGVSETYNINVVALRGAIIVIVFYFLAFLGLFLFALFYIFLAFIIKDPPAPQELDSEDGKSQLDAEQPTIKERTTDTEVTYGLATIALGGFGIYILYGSEGSLAGIVAFPFLGLAFITFVLMIYNANETARIRRKNNQSTQ
jgi:phage shock protein C